MLWMWNLVRGLWEGRPAFGWDAGSGRSCRVCGQGIGLNDGFGMSEGVCPACRADAG